MPADTLPGPLRALGGGFGARGSCVHIALGAPAGNQFYKTSTNGGWVLERPYSSDRRGWRPSDRNQSWSALNAAFPNAGSTSRLGASGTWKAGRNPGFCAP